MPLLQLVTQEEIRCPYCLAWNRNNNSLCIECTAPLVGIENFGAARALADWNDFDVKRLRYAFGSETQERKTYWNEVFVIQYELLQKMASELPTLLQHTILDIRDEVERQLLSVFPLPAETFKEYQEYVPPAAELNEIKRLQIIYETHPGKLFKALAGLSLIQLGEGNESIFGYVLSWNAHYKKNRQERLLHMAHWSVQLTGYFSHQYSNHNSEVMPMLERSDEASDWAKLYLYHGQYNRQEIWPELEKMISHPNIHVALSAALALRKYQTIQDLLVGNIHENTIVLALRYSDERHIQDLLHYLNHASAGKQERIINRCITLKPGNATLKTQIVQWLLKEGKADYIDNLFGWIQIPMIEEVITLLLSTTEGLDVLHRSFISWLRDNYTEALPVTQLILAAELHSHKEKEQQKIQEIQREVQTILYTQLCEEVRKKPNATNTLKLLQILFHPQHTRTARQVDEGLYALSKTDKIANNPVTELINKEGLNLINVSQEDLHNFIANYLENEDTNAAVNNWLYTFYDTLARKRDLRTEHELVLAHVQWFFTQAENNVMKTGTTGKFYKFCKTQKELILQHPDLVSSLQFILENSRDAETKFWIEQIIIPQ